MLTYRIRLLFPIEVFRLLFIFLLIFSQHALYGQRRPIVTQWAKSYGGYNFDDAYSVFQTSDGGFVFAGRALSMDGDVTNTIPGRGKWIVKTDSLGNLLWQQSYNDANAIRSIIQTTDGGYAVCGMTGLPDPSRNGDFWIAKLNSAGSIIWERTYGGSNQDMPYSIIQTKDGSYVIAGVTGSGDGDITDRTIISGYEYDSWVLKLDFAGNMLWSKTYGGSSGDEAHGVIETADGGLAIVGQTGSSDGEVGTHTGLPNSGNCWLLKTNSNGVVQWSKCYGSAGNSAGYSVCQNSDGGFTMGGITDGNGFDVSDYHGGGGGSYDFWVIRTNAAGTIQWSRCFGGTGSDYLLCLVPSRFGGYLMTGATNSPDGDVIGTKGGADYWVVNVDGAGNFVWGKCYGGSGFDYSPTLQETRDGGVIVAGFSESTDGDVNLPYGTIDFFAIKLGHKISTGPISPRQYCAGDSITVRDTLFGTFNPNNKFTIQLSDVNGSFTNPTIISAYALNNSDSSFRVALPMNVSPGTRYRIRVVSSSPTALWLDNGQDITINALPVITKDFLGKDTTLCNEATITLRAPSGYQYRWQDNSTNNQFVVSVPGNYSVNISDGSGCSVKDSILVSYNSIPGFTLGNDTSVCIGKTITLTPSLPAGNYLWNTGSQSNSISLLNNGWYWLQVSNVNCSKRDSLFFTIKPNPSIKFGNDTTLCEGALLLLDATNAGATYQWQDGSASSQFTVDRKGTYSVRVTLDGCDTSADIKVDYAAVPRVSLGKDTTLCRDATLLLNATFPGAQYLWNTGSHDPQLEVSSAGLYSVIVTNACSKAHDTIRVDFEDCICFVSVPSAFSPNNDGRNELFRAYSRCTIESYDLKVFNRYGQIVFASRNQAIAWDGKMGAQLQPEGTYVWTLQYRDPITGKVSQRKGTVQLVR